MKIDYLATQQFTTRLNMSINRPKFPETVKREYTKPGTDEAFSIEFPAISFIKLPNGQELSVFVSFDENNHPRFSIPEDVLKMYVENELSEEAHK